MSDPATRTARVRRFAVICGWVAAAPLAALLVWWTVLLLTMRGSDRMVLIAPFGIFFLGSLVWLILALVALLLGRRTDRPRLPMTLGWVVLAELALGVVLFLQS